MWDTHTHTRAYTNTNHTKVPLIISLLTRRLWDIKIQNFICLEVEKLLNCHRVQNPQKKPKPTPTSSAPPTTRLLLSRSLAVFKSCKSSVWPTLAVKKFCDSRVRRLVWLAHHAPRLSRLALSGRSSGLSTVARKFMLICTFRIGTTAQLHAHTATHTDIWCIYAIPAILFASVKNVTQIHK